MITIVIISNDERVYRVKEHFQMLVKARFCIFSDYEHGLKSVFDTHPAVVFIQGKISDVSGDSLAGQIKGLLQSDAPRIVKLGEGSPAAPVWDDCIDFSLTIEEIIALFYRQLERIPFLIWVDIHKESPPGETVPQSDRHESEFVDNAEHLLDLIAPPEISNSAGSVAIPQPPDSSSGKTDALPAAAIQGVAPADWCQSKAEPQTSGWDSPLPRPMKSARVKPEIDRHDIPPNESIFGKRTPTRQIPWFYPAGFVITLVLGTMIYFTVKPEKPRPQPPQSSKAVVLQPAKPVEKPVEPIVKARITSLPEIIPLDGKDRDYGASHPAWERYVDDNLEFLVFRAGAEIKAIQVLARGESPVSEVMVRDLMRQTLGSSSYKVTSRAETQGYRVQISKLDGGAELALYRKMGSGEIRGVVIEVP